MVLTLWYGFYTAYDHFILRLKHDRYRGFLNT